MVRAGLVGAAGRQLVAGGAGELVGATASVVTPVVVGAVAAVPLVPVAALSVIGVALVTARGVVAAPVFAALGVVGVALVTALAAVAVAVLAALAAVGVPLVAALTVVRVTALARAGGELGLLVPGLGAGGVGGWGSPAESSTVIAMRIGRPHSRLSVSLTIGARRPSRTPFANSFGTASRAVSATSASGWQRLIQCSSFASTP